MRGSARLPSLFPLRLGRGTSGPRSGAPRVEGGTAPKAATRAQTDAVGFAQFALSLARGRRREKPLAPGAGLVLPAQSLEDHDHLRQTFMGKGQFLVRQDQWETLDQLIRETDQNREATACGQSLASLLSRGARADAVTAATRAIRDGHRPPETLLNALDEAVLEMPRAWGIALVVAQAHMDIGRAWLGRRALTGRPSCDKPQFLAHFRRASEVLDPHCAVELNSAVLAEARCELLIGEPDAPSRVADDYEDLIDLDPGNPRHMRRMGMHLLPRWFGSYELLDDLAHETAARTEDIWGEGGYTWVWIDVLRAVPEAAARLDVDRYVQGMQDILEARTDQATANFMAAHTGVAMAPDAAPEELTLAARAARAAVAENFGWIVEHHLRELQPATWAQARLSPFAHVDVTPEMHDEGDLLARTLISSLYAEEIGAGHTVAFTPAGLELISPD